MIRLLGLAAAVSCFATAHAASVTQSISTSASPKAVWAIVGPFDGISAWLAGAASSPADHGSTVGSVRTITLAAPGSPTVREKLTARHAMSYSYAILAVDPKVLPVTGYTSTIAVTKDGSGAKVTWHADFQPAGGADAATAEKVVTGLYQASLANIKKMAEK